MYGTLPDSAGGETAIVEERALAVPPNRVRSSRTPHGTSGCTVALGHSTDGCRMAARRCGAPRSTCRARRSEGTSSSPPGAQSRAAPSLEQPRPPLPRRARPRAAGDDCLLLAALVEVVHSWLPSPRDPGAPRCTRRGRGVAAHYGAAVLPRRPPQPDDLRGAANRGRLGSHVEAGGSVQAALAGAPQAALASAPRLAGSQGSLAGVMTHEQRNPARGRCVRGVGLLCAAAQRASGPSCAVTSVCARYSSRLAAWPPLLWRVGL